MNSAVERSCVWAKKDRIGERIVDLETQLADALERIAEMEPYVIPKDVMDERRKKAEELRPKVLAPIPATLVSPVSQVSAKGEVPVQKTHGKDGEEDKTPSFVSSIVG